MMILEDWTNGSQMGSRRPIDEILRDITEGKIEMPEPKPNESFNDYMKRCIPYVMNEKGIANDQAFAVCNGLWDSAKKGKNKNGNTRKKS